MVGFKRIFRVPSNDTLEACAGEHKMKETASTFEWTFPLISADTRYTHILVNIKLLWERMREQKEEKFMCDISDLAPNIIRASEPWRFFYVTNTLSHFLLIFMSAKSLSKISKFIVMTRNFVDSLFSATSHDE